MRITLLLFCLLVAVRADAQQAPQGGSWTGSGQPQKMRLQIDADKAIMIDELMMLIADTSGKLKVQFIAPADRRPAAAAKLDIEAGDEIAMAAGKKVESLKQLRELYETVKPGDEMKMGLRRGEKSYLVTFVKMDPKDLPQKMIVRRGGGKPGEAMLPALGILAEQKDGKLVVMEAFPNASAEISKGDVVVSLNGKKPADAKELTSIYESTQMGDALKLELMRGDKLITISGKRQPPPGAVIE